MKKENNTVFGAHANNTPEKKRKHTGRISAGMKVAVAFVSAAVMVCVPFLASTSANASEPAKIAEADPMKQESAEKAPMDIGTIEPGFSADTLLNTLVSNTSATDETYTVSVPARTAEMEITGEETESRTQQEETPDEFVLGTENSYVAEIQQRLMALHYMENDEPTTYYGPMTSQAITYFQRKNGITMTGVADKATLELLFSESAKQYIVSEGDRGDDITSMQQRLSELGYSVSATGYFGTETKNAVKAFQANNGLSVDGTVGANTKEMLFSSSAVPASGSSSSSGQAQQNQSSSQTSSSSESSSSGSSSASSTGSSSSSSSSSGSSSSSSSSALQGDSSSAPKSDSAKVEAFIAAAESLLGKPYVLGGKGPDTFDCSGFIYYALNQSGYSIGYMTSYGWKGSGYTTIYGMNNLERGDIICYNGHVGIYLGGDAMIDASSTEGKIRYCYNISSKSYWTRNFICGKRPLI